MDKFVAMQAYVRVVEAGTFTKAADRMGLPKPTVTRLIQTLEKHLQTQLLNRTTRRVTVTADGLKQQTGIVTVKSGATSVQGFVMKAAG